MTQAIFNQIAGRPVSGGDIPCFNNSATAIAANMAVCVDVAYVPSGAGVMGVVLQTGSATIEQPAGITVETIPAGGYGRLRRLGSIGAIASGTVTVGDFLMIDAANGNEGQCKTQTATHAQIGVAMTSGVDLDTILVELAIARNA